MLAEPMEAIPDDAELVAQSLAGNREAFGQIVSQYQSLVCALAYSATGSLSQSEDLAQETFLVAWKQLRSLRQPDKLRPWLCRIARNLVSDALRRRGREPGHGAEPLDMAHDLPAPEPLPTEQVVSREEEAILWRSLERIPEMYREPLVLFYREHRSIAGVAAALELTEDAVKQRLSRGRKLLHEQVLAFVEGTLERTNPGRAFTLGVLAALPVFATSASAATIGATAAKGGAAAKASALLGLSGATLGTLIGLLGGWLGMKASLGSATSKKERQLIIRFSWVGIGLVIGWLIVLGVIVSNAKRLAHASPSGLAALLIGFGILYVAALIALIFRFNHLQRRVRVEALASGESSLAEDDRQVSVQAFEYRSRWTLLGLPLVHIRLGRPPEEKLRPALGWIAIGDMAIGTLFAAGGFAVGGISIGGACMGLVSLGGMAIGGLAIGGLVFGGWAAGGAAAGYLAFGGCALAWHAALGGLAVSKHLAVGGVAQAQHANDAVARALIEGHPLFQNGMEWSAHANWLVLGSLLPIAFGFLRWYRLNKQRGASTREEAI